MHLLIFTKGMDTVKGILTFITRLTELCLQSLHHRFVAWTKPETTPLLLATLTDLARSKPELMAENALLRQQVIILRRQVKRPACTKRDRMLLVLLARIVSTWKQALFIVQPETLLRWHRQGFKLFWKYLIRDNDSKFGVAFARVAQTSGIKILKTPYHAPRANAICERFLGSVRRECLDHLLILQEKQLHRVLRAYVKYFNQARPHQGISQQIPEQKAGSVPVQLASGKVISFPILGGLHRDYRRSAYVLPKS